MLNKEINFDRFVRGLIIVIVLGLAVCLINYLSSVLLPFVVAWVMAYLLFPIVIFFEKKCHLRLQQNWELSFMIRIL